MYVYFAKYFSFYATELIFMIMTIALNSWVSHYLISVHYFKNIEIKERISTSRLRKILLKSVYHWNVWDKIIHK